MHLDILSINFISRYGGMADALDSKSSSLWSEGSSPSVGIYYLHIVINEIKITHYF